MAGMRPPGRGGAASTPDRGQLILAGAFVVAVTLIALTLVLSASNYTTALSDQDDLVTRGGDAITVRESVEHDLERRFAYVMANYDEGEREKQFNRTVENMSTPIQERHSRRGRYVNITQEPYGEDRKFIEGTRLSDDSGFERPNSGPASGDPDWTMATNVQVRNLTLVVTDVNDPDDDRGRESAFNLTFQNSERGNWTFRVYQDPSGPEVFYEVEAPSGYIQSCRRSDPVLEDGQNGHKIDFREGTLTWVTNGTNLESCPALTAIDLDRQHYNVTVTGGTGASGEYSLVVDEPPGNVVSTADFDGDPVADAEETIYGARVNYQYYSPTVTYNTTIEVAPEELE